MPAADAERAEPSGARTGGSCPPILLLGIAAAAIALWVLAR
jgi:hypothetical protein